VKAWATEDATRRLLAAAGKDLGQLIESAHSKAFRPVPLGITTSLKLANTLRRVRTVNVLGLLPGSDPALKDTVVVYTAHHDHFGIGKPDKTGDRIYNGARDNASGVGQMLAVAKAFTALPQVPRRSILFAAVGVEESGLLGSKYYATHPTFPPGKIAADINFDGANIWGRTKEVAQIGYGKSSLDQIAEAAAARQNRTVVPDQFPDRGHYYRSDQFNFAKIGVPALYFDLGPDFIGRPEGWGRQQKEAYEKERYHQPSDEYDSTWNLEGAVEDARVGFISGLAVATMDAMPSWSPGDEFEQARKEALAAVRK
jgi:Zn-dependent M28 family amino/carboxypeptidase